MAVNVPIAHVRIQAGRRMLPGRAVRQDDWRTLSDGLNQLYARHLRLHYSRRCASGSPPTTEDTISTAVLTTREELELDVGASVAQLQFATDAQDCDVTLTVGANSVTNSHGGARGQISQLVTVAATGGQLVTVAWRATAAVPIVTPGRLFHLSIWEVYLTAATLP